MKKANKIIWGKRVVALIMVVFPFFTYSNTDSLKTALSKTERSDTNYVNTLILLSWDSFRAGNPEGTKKYAKEAYDLSKQHKFTRGVSRSLYMQGVAFKAEGNYKESIKFHQKALEIRLKTGNLRAIADSYNSIGDNYNNLGDYENAIRSFIKAKENYHKLNDPLGEAWSYCNIGVVLANQNDNDGAIENYIKAVELAREVKNYDALTWYMNNLGNVYLTIGNYKKARDILEEALQIELDNKIGKVTLAFTYNSIGKLCYLEKNNREALVYYKKALALREETDDKNGIAWSLMDIGTVSMEEKNYDDALLAFSRALIIANEIDQAERVRDAYDLLAQVSFKMGDYRQAYLFQQKYISVKDSMLNQASNKVIHEMKEKHQAEVKDQRIKLLSREKSLVDLENRNNRIEIENQSTQRNILIIGCICILLLAFYIFSRFRASQKQKSLIEMHKQILEEKNHEITQSIEYAKKIQTALLPAEKDFAMIFPDAFILFRPKDIVSGDFFWFSDKGDHVYYATADCTGHGVPGGFMSMLGMSLLNEIIDELEITDCGSVLNMMREKIMHSLKQEGEGESKDGMDMVLVRMYKVSGKIEYAAANNPIIVVERNEAVHELPYDKMPVGVFVSDVAPFKTYTFQLEKGDKIFTFTDGYADQFGGEKRKKFKYANMKKIFSLSGNKPMSEVKGLLVEKHEEWKGELEQVDDVCIIGIRI